MTDRPTLFSGPMVQGLLREIEEPGTGKTNTRRVLKPQPSFTDIAGRWYRIPMGDYSLNLHKLPFAVGDRLWVRETAAIYGRWHKNGLTDAGKQKLSFIEHHSLQVSFDLDASSVLGKGCYRQHLGFWKRPSIFMPRHHSRITLIVTDVRVQRLQDISEEDALAEGIQIEESLPENVHRHFLPIGGGELITGWDAREVFGNLWDSLNADRGFAWHTNPWVVAVTFKPHLCNIDQMVAT